MSALRPQTVWDLPTRLAHWTMATAFLVAWLTAEREAWRLVHARAGYLLAGVLLFRVLWGFVGTRHARFSAFLRAPAAARDYLLALLRGRAPHHTGHNPAGGWAIVGLLALGAATCGTGFAAWVEWGGETLIELHEGVATAMLWLVIVHLAGVVVGSFAHRENLPRAMLTGTKQAADGEAISRFAGAWGVLLLAALSIGGLLALEALASRLTA